MLLGSADRHSHSVRHWVLPGGLLPGSEKQGRVSAEKTAKHTTAGSGMGKTTRRLVIIEAPSNLGLMPLGDDLEPGTRHAPAALRQLGLYDRLTVERVVAVEPPPYRRDDERRVNIRNIDAIADYSIRLADAVEEAVEAGCFPLVLGGDCSILIGSMLGLARQREAALLYVDGHTDFYLPEQSATGGGAGMDLALATGWGPSALTDLEGRWPYVTTRRVAALANRYREGTPPAPIPDIAESGMVYRPLERLRSEGIAACVDAALNRIDADREGFWIHFDVDAIDSRLMPAVDSPQADGLDWQEAAALLTVALKRRALGLQVTIYDPSRDPGYVAGKALVEWLVEALTAEI